MIYDLRRPSLMLNPFSGKSMGVVCVFEIRKCWLVQHNNTKARFLVYIDNFLYNLYVATFFKCNSESVVLLYIKQKLRVCSKVKIIYTESHPSQNAALLDDETGIELRDRSHMCYRSIINYDLDITNIFVVSLQIFYIEVFHITNPPFNEQISSAISLNRGSTLLYSTVTLTSC